MASAPPLTPPARHARLDGTGDPAVVERQRGGHKEKVENKHGGAHDLGHLPAGENDAEEDEHEHAEEHDDGAAEALAGHLHRLAEGGYVEGPGQGQAEGNTRAH